METTLLNPLTKSDLRRQLLAQRNALSSDSRAAASREIHAHLENLQCYHNARSIGGYCAIKSEVQTIALLNKILAQNKWLSLPKIVGNQLIFKQIYHLDDLEQGQFGILEPKDYCKVMNNIEIILVPAVAVSRQGERLGYGRGYYDRFLATHPATTVVLTYAQQVVVSIPTAEHDVRMDWIVTEQGYFAT